MGERVEQQEHRHHFVQAPIAPLDEDGVVALIVGTLGFGLAALICVLNQDWLDRFGHHWWTQMCLSGFVLGVLGTAYCAHRSRARRARGTNRDV